MLNRFYIYEIIFSFLLFHIPALNAQQYSEQQPEFYQGRVIVKFTPEAIRNNVLASDQNFLYEIQSLGVISKEKFFPVKYRKSQTKVSPLSERDRKIKYLEDELSRVYILKYTSPESPLSVIARLKTFPQVEYAEPDYIMYPTGEEDVKFIPNDSLYSQQQFLKVMKAEEAWDVEKGDSTIVVAIVDTGIDWSHPDLYPNIFINAGETGLDAQGNNKRTNGIDDDQNQKVDDWHGWDFAAGANGAGRDNDTRGGSSHGTSVAGLIGAATNNKIGIASIGYRIKILPIKVGRDDGTGGLYITPEVIDYAALVIGARVLNASWGSFGYSKSWDDFYFLKAAQGMLVCGGAGNHGGTAPFYPAAYKAVMGVGVCNANDVISSASGYGPPVLVMTPADGSLSVSPGGGYTTWGGVTSASSPIAAGLAGLVSSHFPQYTAAQVRERIRVTCDNIDAQNPNKKYASYGRVNALRALTDPPKSALRLDSAVVFDPNNNRMLEPNEEVGIAVYLRNYLEPTGQPITLTLVPSTSTGNVTVVQGTATINALGTDQSGNNAANKLTFKVNQSTNYDATVLFRIDMKSGSYEDYCFVSVVVNPSYQTIKSNNLSLTLPADGSLGFRDYPTNQQGSGMLNGNSNLRLAMGGLMIGAGASHVVDAVRSATDYFARDYDFRIAQPTILTTPGVRAATDGSASFDDAYASVSRKLHVNVKMESYDFSNKNIKDLIFTKYTVRNDSTGTISNLRVGLFMDLGQIINNQYYQGNVYYDSIRYSGYCVRSGFPVVGSFVIDSLLRTDQTRPTFWAIDNDQTATGNPFGTYDGFTYQEKWTAMSSFIGRYSAGFGGSYMPNNVGYVISSRAFNLLSGATAEVVFGHYMGTNYNTVAPKIDDAIKYWRGQSSVGVKDESPSPSDFSLSQNYPNPFSLSSTLPIMIDFTIPDEAFVKIVVTNVLGQEIMTITDNQYSRGSHTISFSHTSLHPGVYSYRMIASTSAQQSKQWESSKGVHSDIPLGKVIERMMVILR